MKRITIFLVLITLLLSACGQASSTTTAAATTAAQTAAATEAVTTAAQTTAAAATTAAQTTAAAAATTAAATTAQPANTPASDKYGGTLTSTSSSTNSLNPGMATARMSTWANLDNIYDQLVTKNENDEFIPMLATDWNISADGLTFTFNLRDDVVFHNGEKFNAEAAKKSIDFYKTAEPNLAGFVADDLRAIEEVVVTGEYSIELNLSETSGVLLAALGDMGGCMIAPTAIDNYMVALDQFAIAAGGSGPFIIDPSATILEQKYVFNRNPNYWMKDADGNQLPYLDTIIQMITSDATVNLNNLFSGDFDFISIGDMNQIPRIESTPGLITTISGSINNMRCWFNNGKPPFDDIKVREAVTWAIDGITIQKVMTGDLGFQLPWIVSPKQSYYVDAPEWVGMYDVEKSKALLADAGFPNGFETELYAASDSAVNMSIAELIQEQLLAVNIKANIVTQDNSSLRAMWALTNPDTPAGMLVWNTNFPRIDAWVQYSNDFGPATANNYGKCLDQEFQDQLLLVKLESDPAKRDPLLMDLQNIALNKYFLKMLYNHNAYFAYKDTLKGIAFDFRCMPLWHSVYFEK